MWLRDRHERRKDRAYREPAEARRLNLENDAQELANHRQRLELAREFGAPEDVMASLARSLVGAAMSDGEPRAVPEPTVPLRKLERRTRSADLSPIAA